MTRKLEAAYHEAGHAVMAYLSLYHLLAGPIELAAYGAGEAYIGLIPTKLRAAGLDVTAGIQTDPEVAPDLGKVLVAGLVAEQIAAELDPTLVPNPSCARPDHDLLVQQSAAAGLSRKFDKLENEARITLVEHWAVVDAVAEWLFQIGTAEFADINTFIAARI